MKCARTVLCGGCRATDIPTATPDVVFKKTDSVIHPGRQMAGSKCLSPEHFVARMIYQAPNPPRFPVRHCFLQQMLPPAGDALHHRAAPRQNAPAARAPSVSSQSHGLRRSVLAGSCLREQIRWSYALARCNTAAPVGAERPVETIPWHISASNGSSSCPNRPNRFLWLRRLSPHLSRWAVLPARRLHTSPEGWPQIPDAFPPPL